MIPPSINVSEVLNDDRQLIAFIGVKVVKSSKNS